MSTQHTTSLFLASTLQTCSSQAWTLGYGAHLWHVPGSVYRAPPRPLGGSAGCFSGSVDERGGPGGHSVYGNGTRPRGQHHLPNLWARSEQWGWTHMGTSWHTPTSLTNPERVWDYGTKSFLKVIKGYLDYTHEEVGKIGISYTNHLILPYLALEHDLWVYGGVFV